MDQTVPEPPSAGCRSPSAVALVGFMGAGKTAVGRELAARIGWRFLDTDELIESQERKTVHQIFCEDGEPAFRLLEYAAVRGAIKSCEAGPVVLGLGGGAFMEAAIQQSLRDAHIPAVFLDAPAGELFRRCEQPDIDRPLRRDLQQFSELYEQRRPEYQKALLRVDVSAKPIAKIVQEIISGLNLVAVSGACD